MLGLVKSCIGTKFTGQFGDLIAVCILLFSALVDGNLSCFFPKKMHFYFISFKLLYMSVLMI